MLVWIISRYNRDSVIAWGVLSVVYLGVAIRWSYLIDWTLGMDFLLAGIWSFMTLILAWDIEAKRDLRLAGVAFCGGLVIEWWGTTTNLWHYYTAERPPLWILPAWPVAALAIDRLARILGHTPLSRWAWPVLPAFAVWMTTFLWPAIDVTSSKVIVALMIGTLFLARDLRGDVCIFVAGTLLGVFLEYWGTSRHCWTYYSGEIPPPVAAFAHGFASVAFSRGLSRVSR